MEILIVLVFVSLVLVTAAVVMFIMRVREGDFEHGDRLSLLPLDEREVRTEPSVTGHGDEPGRGPEGGAAQ